MRQDDQERGWEIAPSPGVPDREDAAHQERPAAHAASGPAISGPSRGLVQGSPQRRRDGALGARHSARQPHGERARAGRAADLHVAPDLHGARALLHPEVLRQRGGGGAGGLGEAGAGGRGGRQPRGARPGPAGQSGRPGLPFAGQRGPGGRAAGAGPLRGVAPVPSGSHAAHQRALQHAGVRERRLAPAAQEDELRREHLVPQAAAPAEPASDDEAHLRPRHHVEVRRKGVQSAGLAPGAGAGPPASWPIDPRCRDQGVSCQEPHLRRVHVSAESCSGSRRLRPGSTLYRQNHQRCPPHRLVAWGCEGGLGADFPQRVGADTPGLRQCPDCGLSPGRGPREDFGEA
mmetsp:Transcript_30917/g.78816  ORF Transcript_30917/g.78816 Transcript_30917/m.78816 type:complete len:347 (+) Transcript_30917:575-1615(+)